MQCPDSSGEFEQQYSAAENIATLLEQAKELAAAPTVSVVPYVALRRIVHPAHFALRYRLLPHGRHWKKRSRVTFHLAFT